MSWNSIIGQQRIKELFKKAIEQTRLAHAYLFTGPQGIGKSAFAIELAKVLQCEQQQLEACEICSSCKKFPTLQHPNVYLIFALPLGKNETSGDSPLEKLAAEDFANVREQILFKARDPYHQISVSRANFIKVNSVRDIRRTSALKAFSQGIKVFIILDADQMNAEAANALLKTLEEPYEDSMFILTTSHPERLLTTITSRCQEVRFDPLSDKEIIEALQQQKGIDEKRAAFIARRANGNYSLALELSDRNEDEMEFSPVNFLRSILYKSNKEISAMFEELADADNRAVLEQYLLDVYTWLQDALRIQEGSTSIINLGDGDTLKRFVAHHTSVDFASCFESIEKAISLLNKNVYIPLILLNLTFDLRNTILRSSKKSSTFT
jgi:DNA polymerase-3 subunit delta'